MVSLLRFGMTIPEKAAIEVILENLKVALKKK
jgi:hypothetical protein